MRRPPQPPAVEEGEHGDSYYAPMADLLAGILFIILVLLMSFAIIHYPDADSVPVSPLAQTRPETEPEVDARARRLLMVNRERLLLLQAVVADLAAESIAAHVDPANGGVVVDTALFKRGAFRPSFTGERDAMTLGRILKRRTACHVARPTECGEPNPARLEAIFLDVSTGPDDLVGARQSLEPQAFAAARALSLMGAVVDGEPSLLALSAASGPPLVHAEGRAGSTPGAAPPLFIGFAMAPREDTQAPLQR
jgi:hypothetical protein